MSANQKFNPNSHTPGPWKVERAQGKRGQLYIWMDGEYWGGHAIATVHDRVPESASANARLIAAAPELLEALETILATCNVSRIDDPRSEHFDAGRSAVTKALGMETWNDAKALIKEKYPDIPHLTENAGKVLLAAYDLLRLVEEAAVPGGIGPHEFSRPGGWLERANQVLTQAGRKKEDDAEQNGGKHHVS